MLQAGQRCRALRPSRKSVLTLVLFLPLFVQAGARASLTSSAPAGQSPDRSTLSPDALVEREIKGGEVHTYSLYLAAGQFVHVSGMAYKTRVVLRLFGPNGGQVVERKLIEPRSTEPLRISHVARIAGDYKLEVSAASKDSPLGSYRLRIEELRVAKPEDESRVAAESAVADALQLRLTETAESLPLSAKKYEEALALWRAAGDVRGEANTLADLGSVLRLIGENHQALKSYSQALGLWQTLNDQRGKSEALLSMGLIARTVGENRKALEYYEQALLLRRALKDGSRDSEILNGMAFVHIMLAEYQRGLDLHGEALAICRVTGDRLGEAYALNNIGNAYLLLGDYRQAIVYYDQALKIRQEVGHSRGEANTLSNIGQAFLSMGEGRKALDYFDRALTIATKVGNTKGEALALGNLGNAYKELGDNGKALDFQQQALLRYRKAGDRDGEAEMLLRLGVILAETSADVRALEHLQQAVALYRTVENPPGVSSALLAIANVKRKRNDLDGARADAESALKIIEDVRARVVRQDLRASYLASNRDFYDSYIDLLMQLHAREPSKGYDGEALSVSERARARSLIDILVEARANIREGVAPSLLDRERSLHQRLNENVERLRLLDERQTEARVAATRELETLVAEYEALQAQVRLNSPLRGAHSTCATQRRRDPKTARRRYPPA